jgi:LCP family protein required for cell wall assembly
MGQARERHRRHWGSTARALTVVGVLVLLLVGAGVGTLLWFQHSLGRNIERLGDPFAEVSNRPVPASQPASSSYQAMNVLVLGSDSRISAGDPSQWQVGAQRTDAIMLVHIAADRQSAQVISIPRDSWVPVPGHGEAKVNAAFSYGGPTLMIQTIEELTGVHIDHFVVTDFTSFTSMTDALGGVEITPGAPELTGEQALEYVRERYGLPGGDFDRVQRQQNWMRAILSKVNAHRSDVMQMAAFMTTVSKSVAADDGFTIDLMRDLLLSSRDMGPSDVTFLTAPYAGTGRSADGQSIVLLDRARFDPLMAAVADDTSAAYVAEHQGELTVLGYTVR